MKKRTIIIFLIVLGLILLIPNDVLAMYEDRINTIKCGGITALPTRIPKICSYAVSIIQLLVPIILIIAGSIDLLKSMASGKDDDIKKYRNIFIKKLITAILVFFVIAIVKFVISLVADNETNDIVDCIDCFITGTCGEKNIK